MPKYFFTAKSLKGEPYSGTREAKNQHDLARILRQEGYVLISAAAEETEKRGRSPFKDLSLLPFVGGVSAKEKLFFTRNLQVMIKAGVSLPKAIRTLTFQAKSRKLKKILPKILDEIMRGRNFTEALRQHPGVFSELFCNMVRVGEESGTLEGNLGILVRQMEREAELKSKIKSALVYPAVIIVAMTGIGITMLIVVVPKLAKTFEELQIELPLTTKIVIFLGTFLAERWYLIPFILAVIFFLTQTIFKSRIGRKIMGIISLKIPVISSFVKKNNSTYTVRTLSSLIAAGIPLVKSLEIVADTLSNFYYQRVIRKAVGEVKKGGKLSEALRPYQDLYSLTVIQMIEVGEETGETSEVLEKLGDFFEEEITVATKNLTAVIEPVLMLIIGGAVGFFAISMIQPMYSMLQGVE